MNENIKDRISLNLTNLLDSLGVFNGSLCIIGESEHLSLNLNEEKYILAHRPLNGFSRISLDTAFSAIIVLDAGTEQSATMLLQSLYDFCVPPKIPLIMCVPNLSYKDNTFQLFSGESCGSNFLFPVESSFFSSKGLNELMEKEGFLLTENNDYHLDNSMQFETSQNVLLSKSSPSNAYLTWLKNLVDPCSNSLVLIRAYAGADVNSAGMKRAEQRREDAPFLTVVTRTQGNRPLELMETLLCLTAQTNSNFEVLIIGHKVSAENQKNVEKVISETPKSLRTRVRYIPLDSGNRSSPLNLGFSMANGNYVAVLDDDDLVTDDWVETFYGLSKTNGGSVLHAYAVGQSWERVTALDGLAATNRPIPHYCHPFDYINQILENRCPIMSLAFPRWIFQNTDIRFDETLDTTEDWDFLMRVTAVTGVTDSPKVTSIYRFWQNTETSQSLHERTEWLENENHIRHKLNQMPFVLPKGSINELYQLLLHPQSSAVNKKGGTQAVLYIDNGQGFSENFSLKAESNVGYPAFEYLYDLSGHKKIKSKFRFDPSERSGIVVFSLTIKIIDSNNKVVTIGMNKCKSNGSRAKKHFVF